MTRFDDLAARAGAWWQVQPALLKHILDELQAAGFELTWDATGSGMLAGQLPTWPLDRQAPAGLDDLLEGRGMTVEVVFGHAYPMVCPSVKPVDPAVPYDRWTQHHWHVNGNGTLCLLQSARAWDPQTPMTDVLRKSAGWYVEYRLLEAGVIDAMSTSGVVSDDSYDPLVAKAVAQGAALVGVAKAGAGAGADLAGGEPS